MAKNTNLHGAKRAKQDEFYTQLPDIERELHNYRDHFAGKTVYCNCDDPFESNFFRYFASRFNSLRLKELLSTSYAGSPVAAGELPFEDIAGLQPDHGRKQYGARITEVRDFDGDGREDLQDVRQLLETDPNGAWTLEGNGDFRSAECLALLEQADIVVTNPPFSLFREYVAQLVEHGKQFVIIGNMNAVTYKEIFPLIKDGKMWLGPSISSGDRPFGVPKHYPLDAATAWEDENGNRYIRVKGVRWFTNLEHKKRNEGFPLYERYSPKKFLHYDNYDAINVDKTAEIPRDWPGPIGVPITFLDRFCPAQFEILGTSDNGIVDAEIKTTPGLRKKFVDDYYASGGTGSYREGNPTAGYYKDGVAKMAYKRIFIRNRKPEEPQ